MNSGPTVFIIDDDAGVRQSLTVLLRSMRLESESYASAAEFLKSFDPLQPGCLLLDVRMPGMSGLELLDCINKNEVCIPAIVISAHGDVPTVVRAMLAGAINFLEKPCRDKILQKAIEEAFNWDAKNRQRLIKCMKVRRRMENLTPGEYGVLEKIVEGKPNKVIAADLSISVRTVEVRRSKLMQKMKANSLAELIQMAALTPMT